MLVVIDEALRSDLFSRPAEWAGRARSGPCSGSWCWWWPRVSGAGEDAADSCGGSEGHTSHTEKKQGVSRLNKQWRDVAMIRIFCASDSQCKASLRCECADGSSGSADGGSGCHRCGRGTASPLYESGRGPSDERPNTRTNHKLRRGIKFAFKNC